MNQAAAETNRLVRFGAFELDLRSGELRKAGSRLTLQHQPLHLLSVLLERPGELVTREELRSRLWPEDTFVDFEHGLNAAVKRLRDTLGDAADTPRFVETLPRRGYRFIAPATVIDAGAPRKPGAHGQSQRWWAWAIGLAGALAFWMIVSAKPPLPVAAGGDVSARGALGPITQLTAGPYLDTDPTLSPDGEWMAFASDRSGEGHLDIWMQRLKGGEAVRLTRDPAEEREPTFSADGGRVAFTSGRDGGGIYVMPAHSSGEASVLVRGGAHAPSFSPDGRWLAYSTGPGRFSADKATAYISHTFVVPASGGPPTKVLPDFASAVWPVWSPDGRYLLLTSRRGPYDPPEWQVVDTNSRAPVGKPIRAGAITMQFPVRPWRWVEPNRIFYSAALGGDSWDLWEVGISLDTGQATEPKRLTTGAGLQASPSVVGRTQQLVFASLTHTVNVWSVPVEANSARVLGDPARVTATASLQMVPSASDDGRRLVFRADKADGGGLWMRALDTGAESLVAPGRVRDSVISADGSRAAFSTITDGVTPLFAVSTSGGVPEKICADCGASMVQDYSRDNTRLLYLDGTPLSVFLLELRSGEKRLVLRRDHDLYEASFSSDERWISVLEAFFDEGHTKIWVAPFKEGSTPEAGDWVAITGGESWDDRPRWSPDGNLLYFTSLRDGFHCLWAQRLRPDTRHPTGAPFTVQHFHNPRLSINNTGLMGLKTAVAADRIFINLGELTGNIWSARLQ